MPDKPYSGNKRRDDASTENFGNKLPSGAEATLIPDPQFQELLAGLPDPKTMVGPYELDRKLGQGGMGQVWLARHTTSRRLVALKLLHKEKFDSIERYLLVRREIEAQANLAHPHIVAIQDVGLPTLHRGMKREEIYEQLTAAPMYVAFEFVEDARTLDDLIRAERPAPRRVAELVEGVARALDYAHQQGVYHLDVKPANVLIDRGGRPLLADFGLSSLANNAAGTSSGGTPLYMSPERHTTREADNQPAGDIWSLGVVFYELLTGERPFRRVSDITDEAFSYRPILEANPAAPNRFVELCDACLARDPARRCRSAGHVANELRRWLDRLRRKPRSRAILAASVVLLLVLAGIGYGAARLTGMIGKTTEQVAGVKADIQRAEQTFKQETRKSIEEIQKLYEKPRVLVALLQEHIEKRAEKHIAKLDSDPSNAKQIDEIIRQRDQELLRVEQLIENIRHGLTGDPNPIFAEAARILAEQGVGEALEYLRDNEPAIEQRIKDAKARRDQAQQEFYAELNTKLLQADLLATSLAWGEALKKLREVATDAPEWSRARRELGNLLTTLAEYDEAELHLRAAVALAGERDLAAALNNLAILLRRKNQPREAEQLYRRALALHEQQLGPMDAVVATVTANLGALLHQRNRIDEAELLLRRALALHLESYGFDHPSVARDLNDLASLLEDKGQLQESEALRRGVLEIDEQIHGPVHPQVAIALNNLRGSLRRAQREYQVESLLRRALAIGERTHRPDHPENSTRLSNLGGFLVEAGRFAAAEPLLRRAIAIDHRALVDDHPDFAFRLHNLGACYAVTNRQAEAALLMRHAIAIDEKSLGPEHPAVANKLGVLAILCHITERGEAAAALMRRALEIVVIDGRKLGHKHPEFDSINGTYAQILQARNLTREEVSRQLREVYETEGPLEPIVPRVDRLLGPNKPLGELLAELDAQDRAADKPDVYFVPLDRPITPHLTELLAPSRDQLDRLALSAHRNGAPAEAVILWQAAAERNGEQLDAARWQLDNRMNQGAALRELGALEQATAELQETAADMQATEDVTAMSLGRCLYHLALCQFQQGSLVEAKNTVERSLAAYQQAPADSVPPQSLLQQSQQLAADLEAGKVTPPRYDSDVDAQLEQARSRFEATQQLATLPLDEPAAPVVLRMLGPIPSVEQVLVRFEEQYRQQDKPDSWFLPLSEPIGPHLHELLGPIQE